MRILVTGGAGFIGSHLVDRLMENEKNEVIVADNYFTGSKDNLKKWIGHPRFELIRHDVTEPLLVEVDQIYHLACPASPIFYKYNPVKTIKTNVIGTLNMLGLAKRVGARILLTSTSEVYGDPLVHPQPESYWGNVNPIGVRSCYDEGKRVAETLMFDYHRQHGIEIRIARIFNTYGPRMNIDDGRVVSNFILQALHLVDCSSIGDEGICGIARGCRNLKKLHIRRCYEIGNKGISAIGEYCNSLTDLSLRFCDRVGDEALVAVGQGCSLHHLNVSGCHQIGDAGIIAIARGCPQLRSLDISVLQNLGDMAMDELGEGCPLLKEILLSHCRQITDVGIGHLVRNCSLLESCHMVYCPGITAAGVATVVSSCTNIKKVLVEKWKVSERTKRRSGSVITYLCMEL